MHAAVGPDHAVLAAPALERGAPGLDAAHHLGPTVGVHVAEESLVAPVVLQPVVAEAAVVQQRAARLAGGEIEIPVADLRRLERETQSAFALAQGGFGRAALLDLGLELLDHQLKLVRRRAHLAAPVRAIPVRGIPTDRQRAAKGMDATGP